MTPGDITLRLLSCSFGLFDFGVSKADEMTRDSGVDTTRVQLAAQLRRNVDAGNRTMAMVEAQTKNLDPETKDKIGQVARAVKAAEQRLHSSISNVQAASAEEWPRARAVLASTYETYRHGIAQAERIVMAGPSSPRHDPHRR